MQFSSKDTAIILVEFQKQWTLKGLFHRLIKRQLTSRSVLERTLQCLNWARSAGITIIHAPLEADPQKPQGFLTYLSFGKFFTKGSWKAEAVEGSFQEGDIVVVRNCYNLKGFDAFYQSNLETELRQRGINTLLIAGFATDQCPLITLKTALLKGFEPYLLADCTATFAGFLQRRTEKKYASRILFSDTLGNEITRQA